MEKIKSIIGIFLIGNLLITNFGLNTVKAQVGQEAALGAKGIAAESGPDSLYDQSSIEGILSSIRKSISTISDIQNIQKRIDLNGYDNLQLEKFIPVYRALLADPNSLAEYERTGAIPDKISKQLGLDKEKFELPDIRVIRALNYLVDQSERGAGHEYLSVKRIFKDYSSDRTKGDKETSTEDEKEPNDRDISAHSRGQAADIDVIDYVRCTEIKFDEKGRIISKEKRPLIPIKVQYQTDAGFGEPGTSALFGQNMDQVFANSGLDNIRQGLLNILSEKGISIDINGISGRNFNQILLSLGRELFSQNFPGSFNGTIFENYDPRDISKNLGQDLLSQAFSKLIPAWGFEGKKADEFIVNAGRAVLEERLKIPAGSLAGNDPTQIFVNTGKRKLEEALNIKLGTLDSEAGGNPDLLQAILGKGRLGKIFVSDWPTDNVSLDELKKIIGGAEKFNSIFASERQIDETLGLPLGKTKDLKEGKLSPLDFARAVGEALINQEILIYGNGQSAPEAFGILEKLPLIIPPKNLTFDEMKTWVLDRYNLNNDLANKELQDSAVLIFQDEETTRSWLALNAIRKDQPTENRITRFLAANNLANLFKEIGQDEIAKNLAKDGEEIEKVRNWLRSGSMPINPDTGLPAIDTEKLGGQFGLADKYDIFRIFLDNRGNDVFGRIGKQVLNVATDPTAAKNFGEIFAAKHPGETFFNDRFNVIETAIKSIRTNDPAATAAIQTILSSITNYKNVQSDTLGTIASNKKETQAGESAFVIERELKRIASLQNKTNFGETAQAVAEIISRSELLPQDLKSVKVKLGGTTYADLSVSEIGQILSGKKPAGDLAIEVGAKFLENSLPGELKNNVFLQTITDIFKQKPGNQEKFLTDKIGATVLNQFARQISSQFGIADQILSGDDISKIFTGDTTPFIKIGGGVLDKTLGLPTGTMDNWTQGKTKFEDILTNRGFVLAQKALGIVSPITDPKQLDKLPLKYFAEKMGIPYDYIKDGFTAESIVKSAAWSFGVDPTLASDLLKSDSEFWKKEENITRVDRQISDSLKIPQGMIKDFLTNKGVDSNKLINLALSQGLKNIPPEISQEVFKGGVPLENLANLGKTIGDWGKATADERQGALNVLSGIAGVNLDKSFGDFPITYLATHPQDSKKTLVNWGADKLSAQIMAGGEIAGNPLLSSFAQLGVATLKDLFLDGKNKPDTATYIGLAIQKTTGIGNLEDAKSFASGDWGRGMTALVGAQASKTFEKEFGVALPYENIRKAYFGLTPNETKNAVENIIKPKMLNDVPGFDGLPADVQKDIANKYVSDGVRDIQSNAQKDLQYSMLDVTLHKADAAIPAGFAKTMFTGDDKTKITTLGSYVLNKANLPDVVAALPLFGELKDVLTDPTKTASPQLTSFLDGQLSKVIGTSIPGLGSGIIEAVKPGGSFAGIEKIGTNFVAGKVTGMLDQALGMPAGTTYQIWQAYNAYQAAQTAYQTALNNASQIGNIFSSEASANLAAASQNLANVTSGIIVGVIMSFLAEPLGQVDKGLGLPSGTMSIIVSNLISSALGLAAMAGPALIAVLVLNAIFGGGGLARVEIPCSAGGYYPAIEPKPAKIANDPTFPGEFRAESSKDAMQQGLKAAARWKMYGMTGELLKMNDLLGDPEMLPTQIRVYLQEYIDYYKDTLDREDKYGDGTEGSAAKKLRQGIRKGAFADPRDQDLIPVLHFGY